MASFLPARQMRWALVAALLLLLAAVGATAAVYLQPVAWRVDVGDPSDAIALPDAEHTWNADEADNTYRYRWTRAHSEVVLQDVGLAYPVTLTFRGQGYRTPGAPPAVVTVMVDSQVRTVLTLTNEAQVYTVGPIERGASPSIVVGFDTVPFSPAGDRRQLGFKLDWLQLQPLPGVPPAIAPPRILLAGAVLILGLFAIFLRLFGRSGGLRPVALAALLAALALAGLTAGLYWFRPLVTPWLPHVGLLVGLLGFVAALWPLLARWPDWVDSLAMPKGYAAAMLLALALLAFGLFSFTVVRQGEWIGHADYADNAVVARNLANGRGLVVDYAAQFYKEYPGITHPAETWPLFQPIITAPFFLLFGADTWVAKLPNLLLLLLLAIAVFYFASRWWDKRVGLVAAVLTLVHPYFFQTVLYPINDLAFALLTLLALGWIWEASNLPSLQRRFALNAAGEAVEDEEIAPGMRESGPRIRTLILAGVAAGLLIWCKTLIGVLILTGPALVLLWDYLFGQWAGRKQRASLLSLVWFFVPFGLLVLALLIRNLIDLGSPFYSTESLDAWILRFTINGATPWEQIYANYLPQAGGAGDAPNFRWVTGGKYSYDLLFRAVWRGFQDVWNDAVLKGAVLQLPVFLAAVAGWLTLPRRLYPLGRLALAAFLPYTLVVLLAWHYEARYFQALVPWAYLGVAGLLFWLWDNARNAIRLREQDLAADSVGRRAGSWALLLLPLSLVALLLPAYFAIRPLADDSLAPDAFIDAGHWAAANLPPDAVVMTRNPWEFNWYAQRKAVMIPEGTITDVQRIASLYAVNYIWLGGPIDSLGKNPPLRPALAALYREQPLAALPATLVYKNSDVLIYRLGK